jgi:hypothetical protein
VLHFVTDTEVPSSEADVVDPDEDGIEDEGSNSEAEAQKKKTRSRKPNSNVFGLDWV